jgi:hypothetical protein
VRFTEFLKATVLLSAGSATLLATLAVIGISRESDDTLLWFSAAWWIASVAIGVLLGRRAEASPPIARLLGTARTRRSLPELRPGLTVVNRLWPLLMYVVVFAGLGIVRAPIAAVAAGGAMIWALAWRRQEAAVAAIEERDGVRFYVDRTSPLQPIRLIRTPGFGGTFLPYER